MFSSNNKRLGGGNMEIGEKIRRMRIEKQLTQEELANRCELSKGFISQLENNLTSPSIATLIDILEILGTNLREFFNDIDNEKVTFTKDDMFETEDEDLKYKLKWLVPTSQKNEMEPIIITLECGGQYKEEKPHEGEEFGYVLAGSIYLHIGETKNKVKKGESFYFKPRANHYISNAGKTEAKVIWVSTPPSF
jgi:transcriptional regulator with XRE-family HTH domain